MSATRSFQLSGGRVGPRSVGLYLVYVECMAGWTELSLSKSGYGNVVLFFVQLMVHTAIGCGFSRTYNVVRVVDWGS